MSWCYLKRPIELRLASCNIRVLRPTYPSYVLLLNLSDQHGYYNGKDMVYKREQRTKKLFEYLCYCDDAIYGSTLEDMFSLIELYKTAHELL